MNYSADQVWGLAVRADTANDGYFKDAVWDRIEPGNYGVVKNANKKLVKAWLIENCQPTEHEIVQGQAVRRHLHTFTLKAIAGGLNDFESQALRIAQIDEFTGRDLLEFAIVSYMPELVRRDQARVAYNRELYHSEQVHGHLSDVIVGDIVVTDCRYYSPYAKFKIKARMGESFVDFWYKEALSGELRIRAKIKDFRSDKTTALNYVKRA